MEFPPTVVINLDNRIDRWADIQADFSSWAIPLERVSAVNEAPGQIGCWKSHQKCIQLALDRGYPWILILEDDCVPAPDGKERFLELLPTLWKSREDWDIFNGGAQVIESWWITKVVQRNPPILESKAIMTHFILVSSRMYTTILQTVPTMGALDFYYMNHYRIWCTVPHIAIQKPGKSDIGNADDNREYLEKSADILQTFLVEKKEGFHSSNSILWNALYVYDTHRSIRNFTTILVLGFSFTLAYFYLRNKKKH